MILEYSSVSGMIEAIVFTEGKKYPHPGVEFEDIAQEIRFACVKALQSFDPSRIGPFPYKFLQRCVKNYIYNLNRGTLVPNNPPCNRCEFWNKLNKTCKINEVGCDKIVEFRKRMATKASLKTPNVLDEKFDASSNRYENVEVFILDASIRESLPGSLLLAYQKIVSGYSSEVSTKDKNRIRKIVKHIIADD